MGDINIKSQLITESECRKIVNKNIILLLMGQLVSLFGSSIYSFAISLYILQVTGSGLSFSLSLVLSTLPRVILGPISGVVSDKLDRKKLVVSMDILSGIVILLLFSMSIVDELRVGYIYGATVLLSICNTFFTTPLSASIPNLVDDKNLTKINSLNQSVASLASIAGPFIGGIVFAIIDMKVFLFINGLSFIFSGISEMFIEFKAREKIYGKTSISSSSKNSFMQDLKEGLVYISTQKWLIILGSFVVFINFFVMVGLTVPLPYIAREVLAFSSQQYGILNSTFPLSMLIVSLMLSLMKEKEKNYGRIIKCLSLFGISVIAIGVVTSGIFPNLSNPQYLMILMIFNAIIAACCVLINVPVGVTMQKLVPNEKLGRVQGVFVTLAMGLSPIGAIVAGALIDIVNPYMLPIVSGTLILFIVIVMAQSKELKKI